MQKKLENLQKATQKKLGFSVIYFTVILDFFINLIVLNYVSYTEIDWIAYMQEVEGVLNGNFNYTELKGDTGPLVYPGGFVLVFGILRYLTENGTNIRKAQYIFAFLHSFLVFVVCLCFHKISKKSKTQVPLVVLLLLIVSRRIHSIFALRLFNDGIASLIAYISFYLLLSKQHHFGVIIYSFACSIKMNIILYLPGLAVILLYQQGFLKSTLSAFLFCILQLIVALPFLLVDPMAYISRAVDVNRVFMYKWTVNYKFLNEDTFQSKQLALLLTVLTLSFWLLFGNFKWSKSLFNLVKNNFFRSQENKQLNGIQILEILFTSNFIGVVFFRSLHYQFYSWYFHSLGFLLWRANLPLMLKPFILLGIEAAFNVYPATAFSSLTLHICHIMLLFGLWRNTFVVGGDEGKKEK